MTEFADETAELASYRGQDFLTMYLKACGKTDIPAKMHEWIGLSLLAGLVQDRVTVTLNPHWAPFTLLLYIVLISTSGAGKGLSISAVEKLIKDTFIHVDFFEVTAGEEITAKAALHTLGEAFGVRNEGGTMEIHLQLDQCSRNLCW